MEQKTSKELELEAVNAKTKRALDMEILRHKNAMEELEFMAKHNITSYNPYPSNAEHKKIGE